MGEIVAVRGGQPLDEEALRSHLALLTKLENVGVFLGAGASRIVGGKLVKEIWSSFLQAHPSSGEWLAKKRFVDPEVLENGSPNLEVLMDNLQYAEIDLVRRRSKTVLKDLRIHQNRLHREIIKAAILNDEVWNDPAQLLTWDDLNAHRTLIVRIMSTREPGQSAPWFFTTNYDLAIEWAAESLGVQIINGFSGLHYRGFSPANFDLAYRNVQAKGEARFGTYHMYLVKLHGSLSWLSEDDSLYPREVSTETLKPLLDDYLEGYRRRPNVVILPNSMKYVRTTGFVLGEMFRRFSEFLSRPQTCLIVNGYSFGDEHLNRLFASALQNPTLQLVLYIPEYSLTSGSSNVEWLRRLVAIKSPQVTIVGNRKRAYFNAMVDDLPESALLDDYAERAKKLMRVFYELARSESQWSLSGVAEDEAAAVSDD